MSSTSQSLVCDYVESDRISLLDTLSMVQQLSGYPPRIDVDETRESLEHWLFDEEAERRWVAKTGKIAVGHIMLHAPGEYLTIRYTSLDLDPDANWVEVGKLFVSPEARGNGIGGALLGAGRNYIEAAGRRLVLCVIETSQAAYHLYLREGLVEVGEFEGKHGRNVVMTD